MTVYTPQIGDRVVVESPVFAIGADLYEHVLHDAPEVGSIVSVVNVAPDGSVSVSGGFRMVAEGLLPADDLDLIAAERAFPIGTKVRVVRNVLADGTPGGLGDFLVGKEGTVTGYGRYGGGVEILTDNPGASELAPEAYVVVGTEAAEEAAPVASEEAALAAAEIRRGAAVALAYLILGPDALVEDAVAVGAFILGEEA